MKTRGLWHAFIDTQVDPTMGRAGSAALYDVLFEEPEKVESALEETKYQRRVVW